MLPIFVIVSRSGPRESIPGPGLPGTNAKGVARRDRTPHVLHAAQGG